MPNLSLISLHLGILIEGSPICLGRYMPRGFKLLGGGSYLNNREGHWWNWQGVEVVSLELPVFHSFLFFFFSFEGWYCECITILAKQDFLLRRKHLNWLGFLVLKMDLKLLFYRTTKWHERGSTSIVPTCPTPSEITLISHLTSVPHTFGGYGCVKQKTIARNHRRPTGGWVVKWPLSEFSGRRTKPVLMERGGCNWANTCIPSHC